MILPHPRDELVGCWWLPRLTAKTRSYLQGEMPFSFQIAFGSRIGVDGYFFRHFQLSRAQVIAAVRAAPTDEGVGQWFLALHTVNARSIAAWNEFAPRLGAKGHPEHLTRHVAKWIYFSTSISRPVDSLFEMLVQDEATPQFLITGHRGR
jgi:Domain of unknown function (DUF5069)